jgi:hypothetical protein
MMGAADIARALGGARREGHEWRCRCPLHGGRSLTLRDGDGGIILMKCWNGCEQRDLLAELQNCGLLEGARGPYRRVPPPRHHERHADAVRRIALARAIWDASLPAAATPVAAYLAGRGIVLDDVPACLRWHPCCPHPHGPPMRAIVASVEHVASGIVGIHRTYLTPDYRRHDRAALGLISGGAVRLGMLRAGEWFAVAEGIETALSVVVACRMPAWAALSAGGLRALVLPPEASHVVICADNDASGTGQRAAHETGERWEAEGRRVRIAIPPEPGTDFNDMLLGRAAAHVSEVHHHDAA